MSQRRVLPKRLERFGLTLHSDRTWHQKRAILESHVGYREGGSSPVVTSWHSRSVPSQAQVLAPRSSKANG